MASLVRTAKSGNDWNLYDLNSYNITLNQMDALSFFGLKELPQPGSVDPELLTNIDAGAMQQDRHAGLITYLDLAKIPETGEDAVVDFTVELFRTLGYVRRERVARTRMDLPLLICSQDSPEKIDVCLVDRSQNDILLLVQADKRLVHGNAPAQLVAKAVAAFNGNNAEREAVGLPPLAEKVIPGIVMAGMSPAFFKIPVTKTLSTHIRHGTYPIYPVHETRVTYCYPPVPRPAFRLTEGMKPLDNRLEIFKCYEAFKVIVGI